MISRKRANWLGNFFTKQSAVVSTWETCSLYARKQATLWRRQDHSEGKTRQVLHAFRLDYTTWHLVVDDTDDYVQMT